MAIINSYPDDTTTTDADKFLTVDSSGATKQTAASTLKAYMLPTNGVSAAMLATNAIKIGANTNVTTTQNFTAISTDTALTGFSIAVTVPSGGRDVEVTYSLPQLSCTGATNGIIKLWSGSVGGTLLSAQTIKLQDSGDSKPVSYSFRHTPSAGAITYVMSINPAPNNINANFASTSPGQMWVKNI